MLRFGLACGVVVAALVSSASAQEPKPIKLTLTPAKPPTPALKYQLLPDARVITSGNAADIYRQIIEPLNKKQFNLRVDGVSKAELFTTWSNMPLDQLPKENVRKELAELAGIFELLDKAALCDHCDWGILQRLREKGIGALLPELQPMRECGLLLAVRIRLKVAEGRFDKAVTALRTGFALAKNTGESDTVIGLLVGAAIANIMEGQVDQLVGSPEAPSLYYALTDLPVPLLSQRRAIQGERVMIYGTFPDLAETARNLDAGNLSSKQLQATMKMFDTLKSYGFSDDRFYYLERILLAQNIQKKHEVAKKALIAAGRPRNKVEAMPPIQVALLHALLEYDAAFEEMLAWQGLPYWEIANRLKRMDLDYQSDTPRVFFRQETVQRLKREKDPDAPAIPLLPLFFIRKDRVVFARVRIDRKIALSRTIEAIRFFAATHNAGLPPTLAAIKEVPIPLDPVTGKSFEYQLVGEVAKLRAPPPAKETPNVGNTVVYELRIRK